MRMGLIVAALCIVAADTARGQGSVDTTSYQGLVNAAQNAIDHGEFAPEAEQRTLYQNAEQYARRAVAANPNGAEGHFELAVALGRKALTLGPRDRVKYAQAVHDEALAALKIDSLHAGAWHVLGVWNAEIMRLNRFTRMIAKNLLGGQVFGEASWDNAQRDLERAVALEPNRITHRLDLAAVYADRGDKAKAIEQYEWIARAPATDYNDNHYKEEASRRLADLR